jgi:hypothetical protein
MEVVRQEIGSKARAGQEWIEKELATVKLPDVRLEKRLRTLVKQMSKGLGRSIPWACQDWAATKAAYRFFANGRVREKQILAGHFQATRERADGNQEPVLVVHDTTEFSYRRKDMTAVGVISKRPTGKYNDGQSLYFTTRGINLHSSLAITLEGLPLGLTAVKFWSRKAFKKRKAKGKIKQVPIEEKESIRWLENLRSSTMLLGRPERLVHVGDQESDIFDLFGVAQQLGTHFLVRTRGNRLADGGPGNIGLNCRTDSPPGAVLRRGAESPGRGIRSDIGNPLSASADSDSEGDQEALSGIDGDCDRSTGTADANGPGTDRLEADHRSDGKLAPSGGGKGAMVCTALEDRGLS